MESTWIRPTLILAALAALIVLNVMEFRGKRKRDATDMAGIVNTYRPDVLLAHKQYLLLQNIEQVVHIISSVLIAILIAILTA